jgi:hypothetical protein
VGIKPTQSDPFTPRTSKSGWKYFEVYKIALIDKKAQEQKWLKN